VTLQGTYTLRSGRLLACELDLPEANFPNLPTSESLTIPLDSHVMWEIHYIVVPLSILQDLSSVNTNLIFGCRQDNMLRIARLVSSRCQFSIFCEPGIASLDTGRYKGRLTSKELLLPTTHPLFPPSAFSDPGLRPKPDATFPLSPSPNLPSRKPAPPLSPSYSFAFQHNAS
jgi:hypothetical protein